MDTPCDHDDTPVFEPDRDDLALVFVELPLGYPRQRANWTNIGPDGVRQPPREEY